MKPFSLNVLSLIPLLCVAQTQAQQITCGGFQTAQEGHCNTLIDDNIGNSAPAPIVNGRPAIRFETCAIAASRANAPGEPPFTADFLARRGNSIFDRCVDSAGRVSGSRTEPNLPRTCMLSSGAYVNSYVPPDLA
jgi:hypothetical protein